MAKKITLIYLHQNNYISTQKTKVEFLIRMIVTTDFLKVQNDPKNTSNYYTSSLPFFK